MDRAAGWIIKELKTVFKISLTVLVFMCGILTGKEVEGKSGREKEAIVAEQDLADKRLIVVGMEGIEVYFDSLETGRLYLIIRNKTGNKLQEVSVTDLEINGMKKKSYSFLGGIRAGEFKKCMIEYDAGEAGGKPSDIQVKGNLYIRGSGNILHRKIELHNE